MQTDGVNNMITNAVYWSLKPGGDLPNAHSRFERPVFSLTIIFLTLIYVCTAHWRNPLSMHMLLSGSLKTDTHRPAMMPWWACSEG